MIRLVSVLLFASSAPAFAAAPGVSAELEMASEANPKEKADFAAQALDEVSTAVKAVQRMLEQAQKDKNVENIECLQKKLTPLDSLLGVTKSSSATMQRLLTENSTALADGEFRKIAVALTKARELYAAAQACVGDADANRGDTQVAVTDASSAVETDDVEVEDDTKFTPR